MKKVAMIGLTLLISVAFVTAVFAQAPAKPAEKPAAAPEKAPAPAKAPAPEKKAAAEKKEAAPKAKVQQYTGEVAKMDMAGKSIVVKGKKGDMNFDVANAKMKGEPKEGDKVVVKYTEKDGKMVASSVTKAAAEKKPAEKKPAAEKPAAKPAPDKAAAPAPAPAKPAEPAKK
jgi:hypothetical protein